MKKLTAILISLLLALTAVFAAFAEPAEVQAGWEEILSSLDGVSSVEEVPPEEGSIFREMYLVIFDQPLDWKNPEAGTFPQRVLIGLQEGAGVNVIGTEGYALMDAIMGNESGSAEILGMSSGAGEPCKLVGGNSIQVEHRFFGQSRPADLSYDDVRYWEYHTAENAANDYHHVYTVLAPVLGGRWIATGASRGGDMTNAYGYYFPEDMDVYMPYVAPSSLKMEDSRFCSFVFTEIGDAAFGEEEGRKKRELVLSFQVMMLKNKPTLLAGYETMARQLGCVFRPQAEIGTLYDINVLECGAQFWQYQQVPFEELQQLMDMPETTEEELQSKLEAALKMMVQGQSPKDYSVNCWIWPYYVNAATTYGLWHYDFSYLRQALKDAGAEDTLSVTGETEDGLILNTLFTPEQRAAFTYDGSYREAMLEALKTTDAKYLMIFGATDPWTAVGITECDNPNVKIFFHPTLPHTASVSAMPGEMQAEVNEALKEWLEK